MPACLEVCPTGSRKFGNVRDPDSEVAYILRHKRVFILKEDVGTLPRFFYYFDERGSRYHEPFRSASSGSEEGEG
jgi:molybdopterin-containing oxidoreductase family iron-sulfur binding subunit